MFWLPLADLAYCGHTYTCFSLCIVRGVIYCYYLPILNLKDFSPIFLSYFCVAHSISNCTIIHIVYGIAPLQV